LRIEEGVALLSRQIFRECNVKLEIFCLPHTCVLCLFVVRFG
jgi:hypothetical protein